MLALCVISVPHPQPGLHRGQFWLGVVGAAACRLQERWAFGFSSCPALWLAVFAQSCLWAAPADVGVAWGGCQAHLATWQLLTKAPIQNLPLSWMEFPFPISLILLLRKLLGKHQLT